jgi:putative membrane protein insertion efficiency factor
MIKSFVLFLIWFYQKAISPHLRSRCRYFPTCSDYAKEAVQKYGVRKGSYAAFKRVMRCHPLHEGGYDPVL